MVWFVESLFAGPPVDLSLPDVLWHGDFRPVEEIPPPVRHAAGYELFVERVQLDGKDPVTLAADVRLLVDYLHGRRDEFRKSSDALLDSAGVFLGNALIARVRDARWQAIAPGRPEIGQSISGGVEPFTMVRLIIESDDSRLPEFDHFLQQWDGHDVAQQARDAAEQRAEERLVLRHRPVLPSAPFLRKQDAHLVTVLNDLIEYLTTHYRATATTTRPGPDDPHTISPTVRTIHITPQAPDAAPLVVAVDSVGAIAIRAGALHDFFFYGPNAAELEDTLLAVAAGLYRETYQITSDDIAGYRLGSIHNPDRFQTGGSQDLLDPHRLAAIATQLSALPHGWEPWPLQHR